LASSGFNYDVVQLKALFLKNYPVAVYDVCFNCDRCARCILCIYAGFEKCTIWMLL